MGGWTAAMLAGALALGSAGGSGRAGKAVDPQPVGSPADWFGADQYPPDAMRAGATGRVLIELLIDTLGKPANCTIKESSGNASLDEATCRVAVTRATYTPGRDAEGRVVPAAVLLPVRWALPAGSGVNGSLDLAKMPPKPDPQPVEARITVAADGTVEACETSGLSAGAARGPCTSYPVGRKIMPSLSRDGRPIKAHIVQRHTFTTTFDP